MKRNFRLVLGSITGILAAVWLLSGLAMAQQSIHINLNGQALQGNIEPQIVKGRIFLPARAFCEALGAKVNWDAENSIVNIVLNCDTASQASRDSNYNMVQSQKASNLYEAYAIIVDEMVKRAPEYNRDIKYLAIDTNRMTNLTDQDKTKLLKIIDGQNDLSVINKTEDELKKEGYIRSIYRPGYKRPMAEFKEGIHIVINNQPLENNSIAIYAWKFRTEAEKISYVYTIKKDKDGNWVIFDGR